MPLLHRAQGPGPRRSLDPAAVLAAFQDLAGLGYREVVLTGVDLGQYGLDHTPPSSLAALVRRLMKKPGPSGCGFLPWSP